MSGTFGYNILGSICLGTGCLYFIRKSFLLIENDDLASEKTGSDGMKDSQQVPAAGARLQNRHPTTLKLKNVHIFFRHGARTPLRNLQGVTEAVFDKNFLIGSLPYTEVKYSVRFFDGAPRVPSGLNAFYETVRFKGGCHAGMLTKLGKDQMYLLGRRLRKLYIEDQNFINEEFLPSQFYLRSTNVDRCIESLQCVMAGMFGHSSIQQTDPLVIETARRENETLYPNARFCKTLNKMGSRMLEVLLTDSSYATLEMRLREKTGYTAKKPIDISEFRDHILSRQAHGLPVPKWLEDMQPEIEEEAVKILTYWASGTTETKHLKLTIVTGPLLKLVYGGFMDTIKKDTPEKRMCMYSCHDSTLVPLLISLGCYDNKWPPFASDLRFELYEDDKEDHWVKVSYNDQDQVVGGMQQPLMTLKQFQDLTAPYRINFKQYCHICDDHTTIDQVRSSTVEGEFQSPGL